jgi:hypothetical protein
MAFGLAQSFKTLTADTSVLIEAAITTFSFARLFKGRVKAVVIAGGHPALGPGLEVPDKPGDGSA